MHDTSSDMGGLFTQAHVRQAKNREEKVRGEQFAHNFHLPRHDKGKQKWVCLFAVEKKSATYIVTWYLFSSEIYQLHYIQCKPMPSYFFHLLFELYSPSALAFNLALKSLTQKTQTHSYLLPPRGFNIFDPKALPNHANRRDIN